MTTYDELTRAITLLIATFDARVLAGDELDDMHQLAAIAAWNAECEQGENDD
jgi:hypothetical protein